MSNCNEHKKDLYGETDMKKVAEAIGDLHYETLSKLLSSLSFKLDSDGMKDLSRGKTILGGKLRAAAAEINKASVRIEKAWEISKPFMKDKM